MAKRTALRARIERLENRKARKRFSRTVIFSIDKRDPADVVGMTGPSADVHVMRGPSEPLPAFERRAAVVLGAQFLFRVYREPHSAAERDYEAEWHSAPSQGGNER